MGDEQSEHGGAGHDLLPHRRQRTGQEQRAHPEKKHLGGIKQLVRDPQRRKQLSPLLPFWHGGWTVPENSGAEQKVGAECGRWAYGRFAASRWGGHEQHLRSQAPGRMRSVWGAGFCQLSIGVASQPNMISVGISEK